MIVRGRSDYYGKMGEKGEEEEVELFYYHIIFLSNSAMQIFNGSDVSQIHLFRFAI